MIRIQGKLDKQLYVAFSGGVDSVAAVDFLSRKHDVTLVFFHHGNELGDHELEFVSTFAKVRSLPLITGYTETKKAKNQSWEEYWRISRYEFFNSLPHNIITCHHLDDCVETWVWSSLHGEGKVIPYQNKNIYRPFRLTEKKDFLVWATKNSLTWFEDDSNQENHFTRNYIRNELLPMIVNKVNPGINKVIAKKLMKEFEQ